MKNGVTRRAMLAWLPAGIMAAAKPPVRKGKQLPRVGEFVRLIDPTTETPVVRLTSLASAATLPDASNRFISARERFVILASDRSGRYVPYHLDLRTGLLTALAAAKNLDPRLLTMDAAEKRLYFLDGGELRSVNLAKGREGATVAEDVTAFATGPTETELFVLRSGGTLEYRRADTTTTLATNAARPLRPRPDGRSCMFMRTANGNEREFWNATVGDAAAEPKLLAKGRIWNPVWSGDGQSLLFLREIPHNDVFLSEIHELIPETGEERCVTPTSQFGSFSQNSDGSVFVGASRSKAQPNIILLLRSVRREFTLCEHHAHDVNLVSPVFSPDSRRVYFNSDREGKLAVYSVNVELLVEPTAPSA